MKFKTKLIITFLIVILLPLLMSGVAFLAIGATLVHHSDVSYGIERSDYSTMSDSLTDRKSVV